MERIASFTVDHDTIVPGLYISRMDGAVTTYDLRTRRPNAGDYMDNRTMHSMEHMFATFVRNSSLAQDILYFGPMGCQTGFYLLVRGAEPQRVRELVLGTLEQILAYEGPIFGGTRKECGNYQNLSLEDAKQEAMRYLAALRQSDGGFAYPTTQEETV